MATFGSRCKLMAALAAAGAFVALPVSTALAATPALAATARPGPLPPSSSLLCVPQDGGLYGVSAATTATYFAVGNSNGGAAVFNYGTAPLTGVPAAPSYLRGVAATSSTSAVAVGYTVTGGRASILIMTGTTSTATQVTGVPVFGSSTSSYLYGVAVSSPTNAWAVGYTVTGGTIVPLVLHGTGTGLSTWVQVPTPTTLPVGSYLCGVTTTTVNPGATHPSSFAVGGYVSGTVTNSLILYCLGPSVTANWAATAFLPSLSVVDSYLKGVAAEPTSATTVAAYAVGSTTTNTPHRGHPLIEVWNGTTWAQATPVPDPGTTASRLYSVTIRPTSPSILGKSDVWADGFTRSGSTYSTFIVHDLVYKGTTGWTQQTSPNPEPNDALFGVSASTSPSSAWAVGRQAPTGPYLTEQWNGSAW
jgi:hypothetical protein